MTRRLLQQLITGIASLALYVNLIYFTQRADFQSFIVQVIGLFILFTFIIRPYLYTSRDIYRMQLTGIVFRLALLFALPNLSDDFFRFLWDGFLNTEGLNPYVWTPAEAISRVGNSYSEGLLSMMNSPTYHSVYPPLNQYIFSLAAWVFPEALFNQVVLLKCILLLAEIGSVVLLPKILTKLNLTPGLSALYVLNPLVIIEGVGNLHFEVVTVFLVLTSIYFVLNNGLRWAGFIFALAVQVKLVPLIFFPVILKKFGMKKTLWAIATLVLISILLFLFFIDEALVEGYSSSLNLYFRHFEFNASLYFVFRWIGKLFQGYNAIAFIGPAMAFLALLGILITSWRYNLSSHVDSFRLCFVTYLIYLTCSTTVHPWYFLSLIPFGLLAGMPLSVMTWSFVVFLSYKAYDSDPVGQNLLMVAVEYTFGFLVTILEWRRSIQFSDSFTPENILSNSENN